MRKIRSIFIGLLIFIFLFSSLSRVYADMVLLKNGNFIEGKIIKETEKIVEIEIKGQGIAKIKPEMVDTELKGENVGCASPIKEYEALRKKLYLGEPKSRIKLGNFCLENGLLDEATKEFRRAAELDPAYKEDTDKIDSLIQKAKAENLLSISYFFTLQSHYQKALSYLDKIIDEYPNLKFVDELKKKRLWIKNKTAFFSDIKSLTEDDIRFSFERNKPSLPYHPKDTTLIIGYLHNLKEDKQRKDFSDIYYNKAEKLMDTAEKSKDDYEKLFLLTISKRLFYIADEASAYKNNLAGERLKQAISKLKQQRDKTFIIPSYVDIKIISSFLENSDGNTRRTYTRLYRIKAHQLREDLTRIKDRLEKKQILQQMLNCYLIIYVYDCKYEKGRSKDLITLLYYDAKKRLGQIR